MGDRNPLTGACRDCGSVRQPCWCAARCDECAARNGDHFGFCSVVNQKGGDPISVAPVAPAVHRSSAKGRRIHTYTADVFNDCAMMDRDNHPARHLSKFEPYLDIDGREIVGPGRSARRSWLNTAASYRTDCMLGTPTVTE